MVVDDGYSKINFGNTGLIVRKAAEIWGSKVDGLDDFVRGALERAANRNGESPILDEAALQDMDENSNTEQPLVKKSAKQKSSAWNLDDIRSPIDIFRPVSINDTDTVENSKQQEEMEKNSTLRPRIKFELHPIRKLPVSVKIKNHFGDKMDFYDFFLNTFDVDQVLHLLSSQNPLERTMEMMDTSPADEGDGSMFLDNEFNLGEPVELPADSEPVMSNFTFLNTIFILHFLLFLRSLW